MTTGRHLARFILTAVLAVAALALAFGAGYATASAVPQDDSAAFAAQLRDAAVAHAAAERGELASGPSFVEQVVEHAASERAEMTAGDTLWRGVLRHLETERAESRE